MRLVRWVEMNLHLEWRPLSGESDRENDLRLQGLEFSLAILALIDVGVPSGP